MKKAFFVISLSFLLLFCDAKSEIFIKKSTLVMADSSLAAKIVSSQDDYTKHLGAYDLSIASSNGAEPALDNFLEHLAKNVREWNSEEIEKFKAFAAQADSQLADLNIKLPKEIILIKTSSYEYGGITAAYTRQNAIMITEKFLKVSDERLYELFLHEIFHIYSRENPGKKAALYKIIGFFQAGDVSLPDDLYNRRISNPDAPDLNTYINLIVNGDTATYTPIMYARQTPYDPSKPGGIFQSSAFGLIKVQGNADLYVPVYENGLPVIINPAEVDDFWKKIGRNTQYIIHPEEIMASNFVYLVTKKEGLPNPEIIEAMRKVINQ